jgi:hypothetical protein
MAGRYSSNGSANFDVFLKGHAGEDLRVDRISRASEFVERATLTIGLAVQPDVIRCLQDNPGFRGRGLLGRFLYAMPTSNLGRRLTDVAEVPEALSLRYTECVLALLRMPPAQDADGKPTERMVEPSAEAAALLRQFRMELEPELAPEGRLGTAQDWAGKLAGALGRIATVLHFVAHADVPEPWTLPIGAEAFAQAIAIARYLEPHALLAFQQMGADPHLERARTVLSWVKRQHRAEFSKRDAFNALRSTFRSATDLDRPLEILQERSFIRLRAAEARPGRPASPRFEVNPAVVPGSADSATSAMGGPALALMGSASSAASAAEVAPPGLIAPAPEVFEEGTL